jgi:hypothetical protein
MPWSPGASYASWKLKGHYHEIFDPSIALISVCSMATQIAADFAMIGFRQVILIKGYST